MALAESLLTESLLERCRGRAAGYDRENRFFTEDFTADVYTPAGFAWVRDNDFRSVMTRHLPELAWHFADVRNLFFPWQRGEGAT